MATIGLFGEPLAFSNQTLQDGAGRGLAQPATGSSIGQFDAAMNRAQRVAQLDPAAVAPPVGQVGQTPPVTAPRPLGTVGNPLGATAPIGAAPVGAAPAAVPPAGTAATQPRPVSAAGEVDARDRARRALGLEPAATTPAAPGQTGDAIIEGMQKLRGVFDTQTGRLASITETKNFDISTLMQMQMEVVRFSLLVEVTSKLTGKSTQAFDTLMKGQ